MNNENQKSILFLGPSNTSTLKWLEKEENNIITTSEPINPWFIQQNNVSFIVSHGYRHIIEKEILDMLPNKVINLHISYLPWNKGADPNLWSFIENTPKGITIHYINEGLDTGDIIIQKKINFPDIETETLATTYEKLNQELLNLFIQNWENIKTENCARKKQSGKGSCHKIKDKEKYSHLLTKGWDTPISNLPLQD